MKFYVTGEVFEKMPNACFGLVSVRGLDNKKSYPTIEKLLKQSIKSCEEHFEGKVVKQEKELICYRDAFLKIGINPNKFMSSIEALLTRISKKKGLPEINPVVDLGNAISLKYYLPVGAHDLKTMEGDFCVRISGVNDTYLPFGSTEREPVESGEVVYATGEKIRTRRWIWRQSEEGKIDEKTSELLFILDGFTENLSAVIAARDELCHLLQEQFSCQTKIGLIDIENREFSTQGSVDV